jgi:hypothetical protein
MSTYLHARIVREQTIHLADNSELTLRLLHGEAGDAGRKCIHRIHSDHAGRLRSDIVYFYDLAASDADVEADFGLLSRGGLMSVSQLHHSESMLNRGARTARRA